MGQCQKSPYRKGRTIGPVLQEEPPQGPLMASIWKVTNGFTGSSLASLFPDSPSETEMTGKAVEAHCREKYYSECWIKLCQGLDHLLLLDGNLDISYCLLHPHSPNDHYDEIWGLLAVWKSTTFVLSLCLKFPYEYLSSSGYWKQLWKCK